MAGPTSDYGYTSFGPDTTGTPGYVTEIGHWRVLHPRRHLPIHFHARRSGEGHRHVCHRHRGPPLRHAVRGHPAIHHHQLRGTNQVINFSVDGSPVAPRRTVVAMANCNACHSYLEVHGDLRNNVQYCVLCHNPSNTDSSTRVHGHGSVATDRCPTRGSISR